MQQPVRKPTRRSPKLTVLVVDNSKNRGREVEIPAILRELGYPSRTFRDLRRAAETVRKGEVQVTIVVVSKRRAHPPQDVIRRLHEANPDVPTIVVTPQPSLDEAVALLRARAYDYLDRARASTDLRSIVDRIIAEKGFTLTEEERLLRDIGERLRETRRDSELTLQQLASRAGLSISLISQIETSRTSPSVSTLLKLSRALGRPMTELFAGH